MILQSKTATPPSSTTELLHSALAEAKVFIFRLLQTHMGAESWSLIYWQEQCKYLKLWFKVCFKLVCPRHNDRGTVKQPPSFMWQQTQNKCIFQFVHLSICQGFAYDLHGKLNFILMYKLSGGPFFRVCTEVPSYNSRSTKCRCSCIQKDNCLGAQDYTAYPENFTFWTPLKNETPTCSI